MVRCPTHLRGLTFMRITDALLPVLLAGLLIYGCSGGKYREPGPRFAEPGADTRFAGLRKEEWKEVAVNLPDYPMAEDLQPFNIEGRSDNNFFVDRRSVSLDEDGVVRYTVVVRTPAGVENISYEGIHCREQRWKSYAIGQLDRTWSESRTQDWRRVERLGVNAYHVPLYHAYFCPDGFPVRSAEGAVAEMRRSYKEGGPLSDRR